MSDPCTGALDLIAGLKELEAITGSETFVWNEAVVPCVAPTLTQTNAWEPGGLADNSTDRLYVRKQALLTADSTMVTVDTVLVSATVAAAWCLWRAAR